VPQSVIDAAMFWLVGVMSESPHQARSEPDWASTTSSAKVKGHERKTGEAKRREALRPGNL